MRHGAAHTHFGKEFWETKDPAEWNADEIAKLLMKSPWAKGFRGNACKTQRSTGRHGWPANAHAGQRQTEAPSTRTVTTYKGDGGVGERRARRALL